jgi:hypothetical protein
MGDKLASAFTAAEQLQQLQQLERHWVWGGSHLLQSSVTPTTPHPALGRDGFETPTAISETH